MRAVILIAVLGGCTMSTNIDDMRDSVREAQHEDNVHIALSRTARDLPSLVFEVDRHSLHMSIVLDDMSGHMSAMHHCSGMATMWSMRDEMQVEVDDHHAAMHAMTELAPARAADEDHVSLMNEMLDRMDMQLGAMHCDM